MGRQSWDFSTIHEYNRNGKCFVSGGRDSPFFEFLQLSFGDTEKQLSYHHSLGHVYTLHAVCVGQVDYHIPMVQRLRYRPHFNQWPRGDFLHDWHLDVVLRWAHNVVHNQEPDYTNRKICNKRGIKSVDWYPGLFLLKKHALELSCVDKKVSASLKWPLAWSWIWS